MNDTTTTESKRVLAYGDYLVAIQRLIKALKEVQFDTVFGIPRGGYFPAGVIAQSMGKRQIFDPAAIDGKTLIVDDICDSGATMIEYNAKYHASPCAAVFRKSPDKFQWVHYGVCMAENEWIVLPDEKGCGIEENFKRTLQYIGEDVTREGVLETPKRMRRAYDEIFAGYKTNPKSLVKTFTKGSCKELVILKNCEFYSVCEHHFFPFFGHCSIGYIPNGKVIGVSKLARLLDCFSKRMQIQERMTSQIADFLEQELDAKGVYVVCEGVHFCMTSRGIKKQDANMVTSAIRGDFLDNAALRAEFLSLVKI